MKNETKNHYNHIIFGMNKLINRFIHVKNKG